MMAKWLRILPFFLVVYICKKMEPEIWQYGRTKYYMAFKDVLIRVEEKNDTSY